MPGAVVPAPSLLPDVVLLEISRQIALLLELTFPSATRMPYTVPLGGLSIGVPIVFLRILTFVWPTLLIELMRIPLPEVLLMLLVPPTVPSPILAL